LTECGRAAADIHGHVIHFAQRAAHQLALGKRWQLVVQPAQHALAGAAVVVLDKFNLATDGFFKALLVETFEEKPRSSPNTAGSMILTSAMAVSMIFMNGLLSYFSSCSRYCP
jgi:hypothetical protein